MSLHHEEGSGAGAEISIISDIFNYEEIVRKVGGAVASWLVRSILDRAVRVRDLAGDITWCSWARRLPLAVPLSIQVFKWVLG